VQKGVTVLAGFSNPRARTSAIRRAGFGRSLVGIEPVILFVQSGSVNSNDLNGAKRLND
jgi:hypothetical protein